MRAVIIWRDNTDYSREVLDWLDEFEKRTSREVESLDPDHLDGESLAKVYDVVEYPTILALDNEGKLLESWRGTPLPRIDEVAYYAAPKQNL